MDEVMKLESSELIHRHGLMNELRRLCREDPLSVHCYTIYYSMYEYGRVEVVLLTSGGSIDSYALIWFGSRFSIQDVYEVHIWRPTKEVVEGIDIVPSKRADIQLYEASPSDVDLIINHFRELGFKRFSREELHDMVCDSSTFRSSPLEYLATRLGEEHALLYKELELERGVEVGLDEAKEILRTYTHYGVIVNDVLASIAARYVTLPEIHVIGGVFTRREYRGRGYAKAVTSALTKEAVKSGATAGLHVEVGNEAAIRTYRALGYRIVRTRTWVFAHP